MEPIVDLRSDTVTRPTPAMRRAMAEAVVGDDVFGDDPTVIELERRVAALAGKEAALYVPSGTMGNQLAIRSMIEEGDEVIVERESHIFRYEQGGIGANSGGLAHPVVSERGAIPIGTLEANLPDEGEDDHDARLALVCLENTHNRHGGAIVPLEQIRAIAAVARGRGVRVHLDGARLWNASVATGIPIREWAAPVDTLMMCFSKGLGAPIGSILVGAAPVIRRARRHRKRWGGGMRQVGVIAAACLHALDHHVERLAEDHRRARALAAGLRDAPGVEVAQPETNIVFVDLIDPALETGPLLQALEARGVRLLSFGPRRLRAITHLDVDDEGIARAVAAFHDVLAAADESIVHAEVAMIARTPPGGCSRPGTGRPPGRARVPRLFPGGSTGAPQGRKDGVVTETPSPGTRGTLFLVATPIGNLEDVTRRALRILGEVDLVAAEDTRHTRRLLNHFGIEARLVSLFEHNERGRVPGLVRRLGAGESIALVTDAGSPGVSDPGYPLVRAALAEGIRVESVPGPSAVIAALQVSGLPTDAFTFAGFLPPRGAARRKRLEELEARRETVIAFESPHRIEACLDDLEAIWKERPIALARELTKMHEQVLRGSAREVRAALTPERRRGEMVLVLSGRGRARVQEDEAS